MKDRLQHLSLVCKQWRELCSTPSLVSSVALGKASSDTRPVSRAAAQPDYAILGVQLKPV
ncbi:hypothetical protein C2E21_8356 [Chlorella sorokiniana]|uniref:Uncharacterized protein n=1 Tax=Chlorella sorokiniana TaxID=3076 RepID=A0A2P6TEV7_CHLSO|nr:hypothetical protein C2E21_8356 [Chlorella sorokiniana]|eukprot:PRW32507.1 hypothetical protein C2E21_8356 [Chlorella sorokiniana]